MARPLVVTLPFVLLLIDFWPLRRPYAARAVRPGRLLLEKLPLLGLAVAVSVTTLSVQKRVGPVACLDVLPLGGRIRNAVVGYVIYLWKTIWPTRLAAFYPFKAYPLPVILLAAAALVVITIFAIAVRRRWPFVTVGWLWYLVTLAPVIGLMQAGEQAMADRFMYIPLV